MTANGQFFSYKIMPADFTKCQNEGGKIRTKTLKGGKYMPICIDKTGKSYNGYMKTKDTKNIKSFKKY